MSRALKIAIEANDPLAAQKALKTVKDLSRKLPKADAPLAYACKMGAAARIDRDQRAREEAAKRVLSEAQKAVQARIASQSRRHGDREQLDGLECAQLLLDSGADATRTDRFGNDALMYYEWERWRDRAELNGEFVALLEQAGATGGGATFDLFRAIREDDIGAARAAIESGADVNRDGPMLVSWTPLVTARSTNMVKLLLGAGGDPGKPSINTTPLISAAGSGQLEIVKILVEAGADIHAIEPRPPNSEYLANAYSSADLNRKYEVVEYLKSLGAGKPVLKNWKPLDPGVGDWENFSEIIVKGDVLSVANAVSKIIGGTVQSNVYGKSLLPGKTTYLVLRPKGMAWCNLFQLTPRPNYSASPDTKFLLDLSRTSGYPVILAQYSDAAGAADIERFEPDGSSQKDEGWDRDTLAEVVSELGDKAPEWMKKRLAEMEEAPEEEVDSSNRLSKLAEEEIFVIAWGGLDAGPGRKVEISFTNLPAEAFDGASWVSRS